MTGDAEPDRKAGQGRLVAVVVTHRRLRLLKVTLAALLANRPEHLAAVVVIDNASDDGTGEWLQGLGDSRVIVQRNAVNAGGAGGFEQGMRLAMQRTRPDWLLLLDDDARPEPGALAAFHATDLAGWDGLAAAVLTPDGTPCEMNRPVLDPFRDPARLLRAVFGAGRDAYHLGATDFARPGLRPIDGASFVGFFLRAGVVARRGYPDPRLFLYGDDAIYTQGLTAAGHRVAFAPAVRFVHETETLSAADPRIRPLWKVYYYHRNLLILYRNAAGWLFLPVLAWFLPRWALRIRHYGPDKGRFARLLGLAIIDGLRRRTDRPHAAVLALADVSATATRDGGA